MSCRGLNLIWHFRHRPCAGVFALDLLPFCYLFASFLLPSCILSASTLTTYGLAAQYALFQHDFSLLNRSKISIHNTHLLRGGYFLYVSISYPIFVFLVLLYICNTKHRVHPINTGARCITFVIHRSIAFRLLLPLSRWPCCTSNGSGYLVFHNHRIEQASYKFLLFHGHA